MNYEVVTTEEFLKDAKSILKVYPGFKRDIQSIILSLGENPEQGSFRLIDPKNIINSRQTTPSGLTTNQN